MDQIADTAWCPLGCYLSLSNSIASVAFQEIFTTPAEIIVFGGKDGVAAPDDLAPRKPCTGSKTK
jgi:hypothetical protein